MAADRTRHVGRVLGASVLALAGLVVTVQPALAHGGGMMGGGASSGSWGGASGFGLGFLWPLLLLGGLAALVYWTVGNGERSVGDLGGSDTALETLRDRYARGEISEEEFEQRRQRLER